MRGHHGGISLPLNVSQCRLGVRLGGIMEGCLYHSIYHSVGWRSGEEASWRDVTTTQCITVQAGGQVMVHHRGMSLPLNVSQCRLEVR